jgi:hypothetical protein
MVCLVVDVQPTALLLTTSAPELAMSDKKPLPCHVEGTILDHHLSVYCRSYLMHLKLHSGSKNLRVLVEAWY